jgi:hypothetical protein
MSISKCIVRLKDCHDTEHRVEVYAESLYEAVLRGLSRLQDVGWESNGDETIKRVEVENSPRAYATRSRCPEAIEVSSRRFHVSSATNKERKIAEAAQHIRCKVSEQVRNGSTGNEFC